MIFDEVITTLNQTLKEKQPLNFSPSWIFENAPHIYSYVQRKIRTENNDIDWDKITGSLERTFQKRWIRYNQKQVKFYERQSEIDVILTKYKDKLYTFISPSGEEDRRIQQTMIISLVRIGQKGNICAQEEVVKWVTYITDD